MGFLRKLIYATLIPQEVREAVKIDELKKLNEQKKKDKKWLIFSVESLEPNDNQSRTHWYRHAQWL